MKRDTSKIPVTHAFRDRWRDTCHALSSLHARNQRSAALSGRDTLSRWTVTDRQAHRDVTHPPFRGVSLSRLSTKRFEL